MTQKELLEAWRTNNRINLYLIDRIETAGMTCTLSKRGGRDVARQFAHMHNVRVWQLEKRAKDLAAGLTKFETKVSPGKKELKKALTASSSAVEKFLADVLAGQPKRRGFKKGMFTTLAYFVAHESHHRGIVFLTLKQCGHKLSKEVRYNIWGWDQM
jgi:uncharacterized damage-inducible protein DinB